MTPDEKHNMIEPYDAVDLNDIAEGDAADELYEHFAITVDAGSRCCGWTNSWSTAWSTARATAYRPLPTAAASS